MQNVSSLCNGTNTNVNKRLQPSSWNKFAFPVKSSKTFSVDETSKSDLQKLSRFHKQLKHE